MLLKLYLNLENILDLVCVREGLFSVLVDVVLLLIISLKEEKRKKKKEDITLFKLTY